ncbi:helix-turn-helix domain-containing protein [Streptomyces hokutonensis]|uniref:helix-turn-helix domain-containing protein n=1 Tax=Streptomyces hokutonensis TaxID=1306990 RepID=UPI00037E6B3E|nr:XRE family transcriptional regulator [Streptomyces hokutonensis]
MPDELDPQVKEFAGQLRRLVDRSGLSVAAVADRTGYSKTSWDRYLNGRLLAPKGAIVALAEVTGTHPVHLTTMWELAERAWSRSEMRHDMTMEAMRISQARAALGEFGAPPSNAQSGKAQSGKAEGGKTARKGGSATATPGIAGPAGVSPTVPPQPAAPESDVREGASQVGNSWGLAGYAGSAGQSGGAGARPGAGQVPESPVPHGELPRAPRPGPPDGLAGTRRRLLMFSAGVVGVMVVIAAVFLFTNRGDGDKKTTATHTSASPSVSTNPDLPAGVKCVGAGCTGKDAEAMGCTTDAGAATTAKTATVGTTVVEVRYSKTCGAAWGRITAGVPGDSVRVSAGTTKESDSITAAGDNIAYTPMVAVKDAGEAKACVTLASGQKGCTT